MIYGTDYYTIIKAVHVIFMVSYFAGIFYLIRLFIYHREALDVSEIETVKSSILSEQFKLMQSRLWNIIIVPAGLIMLITGLLMLLNNWSFFVFQTWMQVKLTFLLVLALYHYCSWRIVLKAQKDQITLSSVRLRLFNEVPTLLLFIIVFSVILKGFFLTYWYWIFITFIGMGLLIMAIVKLLNKKKN